MKESELETGDLICMAFDYNSPAELFMPKHKGIRRRATPHYRRFATAAEAIRFAVEEMPAVRTLGAWMQVGDERFNSDEISKLYESSGYPLQRDVSRQSISWRATSADSSALTNLPDLHMPAPAAITARDLASIYLPGDGVQACMACRLDGLAGHWRQIVLLMPCGPRACAARLGGRRQQSPPAFQGVGASL